jgi:hypothetical protein
MSESFISCTLASSRLLLRERAMEAATISWFSWVAVMSDSREMAICFQAAMLRGTSPVTSRTSRRV